MCDPDSRRIFCLVCEYNMSYKLAKETVQDLRELMQGKTGMYAIMCHKHTIYRGVECEVRVGEYLSEPFEVESSKSCHNVQSRAGFSSTVR